MAMMSAMHPDTASFLPSDRHRIHGPFTGADIRTANELLHSKSGIHPDVPHDPTCGDYSGLHHRGMGRVMKLGLIFRPSHIDTFAHSERLGWIRVRCNKRGGGCEYPRVTTGPFNAEIEASAAMRYKARTMIEFAEGEV